MGGDHIVPCVGGGRGGEGRGGGGFAAPVVVRAHIPEEVKGKLACLLLAVEFVALLSLSQLVSKGVAQLVLPHVLLQAVQALNDLGIRLEAGSLEPLAAATLVAALLLHFLSFAPDTVSREHLACAMTLLNMARRNAGKQTSNMQPLLRCCRTMLQIIYCVDHCWVHLTQGSWLHAKLLKVVT